MNSCDECLQYLLDQNELPPEKCYDCGKETFHIIQGEDGTFGGRCSECGAEAWADLNTPCEEDETEYKLVILPFDAAKEDLMDLSKKFGKKVLETKKILQNSGITITGSARVICDYISWADEKKYKFEVTPGNPLKLYHYQKKCRYPYRIR